MSRGGVLARWQVVYTGRGTATPAQVLANTTMWSATACEPVTPDGAIAMAKKAEAACGGNYAYLVRFGESPRWLVMDGHAYPLDAKGRLA